MTILNATHRRVTNRLLNVIDIKYLVPSYLVHIKWASANSYLSTVNEVEYNGNTYSPGFVSVLEIDTREDGRQDAKIRIFNKGNIAVGLLLNNVVAGTFVDIYLTYLYSDRNTPPVKMVSGIINSSNLLPNNDLDLNISSASDGVMLPNTFHTRQEGFSYLPVDGRIILWNDEVYEFRSN